MIKIILYISLLHNLRKFKTLITFTIDKLLTQNKFNLMEINDQFSKKNQTVLGIEFDHEDD
jgi:hypothetical protein